MERKIKCTIEKLADVLVSMGVDKGEASRMVYRDYVGFVGRARKGEFAEASVPASWFAYREDFEAFHYLVRAIRSGYISRFEGYSGCLELDRDDGSDVELSISACVNANTVPDREHLDFLLPWLRMDYSYMADVLLYASGVDVTDMDISLRSGGACTITVSE